jgi:Lipocalin-like domain
MKSEAGDVTSSGPLVGTWRLVSFVARGADGRETATYGSDPRGLLIYDKGCRMSVQIARGDLEEYFGYFGRYTVDEGAGTVTHHIEGASHPNFVGTDQRRLFTWQNECLVLSTPPSEPIGGSDVTYVATWQRQR